MKFRFLFILIMTTALSTAFGQAGPRQEPKAKPDSTAPAVVPEPAPPPAQQDTVPRIQITHPKSTVTQKATVSSRVSRALFSTAIEEREPVGSIDSLSTEYERVYFFTEITGLAGHTISHLWTLDGDTLADVSFEIGGSRWRIYSSKKLLPSWTGIWKVDVVDEDGSVLATGRLTYFEAEETE